MPDNIQHNDKDIAPPKFQSLKELSGFTFDEVVEMVKEIRKNSSVDIERMQALYMHRLVEESRIMKRATELNYRQALVHFDI